MMLLVSTERTSAIPPSVNATRMINEIINTTPRCLAGNVRSFILALAFGGGLVALYHSLLYVGVIPAPIVPCTGGPSCSGESMAIGGVPLPLPSLTAFALILTLLLNFQRRLKS